MDTIRRVLCRGSILAFLVVSGGQAGATAQSRPEEALWCPTGFRRCGTAASRTPIHARRQSAAILLKTPRPATTSGFFPQIGKNRPLPRAGSAALVSSTSNSAGYPCTFANTEDEEEDLLSELLRFHTVTGSVGMIRKPCRSPAGLRQPSPSMICQRRTSNIEWE